MEEMRMLECARLGYQVKVEFIGQFLCIRHAIHSRFLRVIVGKVLVLDKWCDRNAVWQFPL